MAELNKAEELQEEVQALHITSITELKSLCDPYRLEPYEDVLSPIEWNSCDRCGALVDSTLLLWLDYALDDDKESKQLERGIIQERQDYCAICDECAGKLMIKGGKE